MPAIEGFTEEWRLEEGILVEGTDCGRALIHGLPYPFEETRESLKCFANVEVNVLILPGSVSPHYRGRNGFSGKTYASHRCEPDSTGNNGILAIERQLPPAVRGGHFNVCQNLIHSFMEFEPEEVAGLFSLSAIVSVKRTGAVDLSSTADRDLMRHLLGRQLRPFD